MQKRAYPMKIGRIPHMILMFIGTDTASVLVMRLYWRVKEKYLVIENQLRAHPKPIKNSVVFKVKLLGKMYVKLPNIVLRHPIKLMIDHLLNSEALSQKSRLSHEIFLFLFLS